MQFDDHFNAVFFIDELLDLNLESPDIRVQRFLNKFFKFFFDLLFVYSFFVKLKSLRISVVGVVHLVDFLLKQKMSCNYDRKFKIN